MLRPYQADAVGAATAWMLKSKEPALLELATGAGKSWIAAYIAQWIAQMGKKTLILQPSKELTEQNHAKYLASGNPASIFSASAGKKCTQHMAIYGTPVTVLNGIDLFGDEIGCIIIDECHRTTDTHHKIIAAIKAHNPNVRVIGMTATPYRMKTGYIYACDYSAGGKIALGEDRAITPYYHGLLYRINTQTLIDMGYLTPMIAEDSDTLSYDTSTLTLNNMGRFDASGVSNAFENKGRLTHDIVCDIIQKSHDRRGVMLFASTVQHAKEIMGSLPPHDSMMLGGDINMGKKEREQLITDFKAMRFKYIVSVGTLTTGFDAPHVDMVAVLRPTESASLFQQIIGRGLRLCEGKSDCLLLDYAENIERHGLEKNLFEPKIETEMPSDTDPIEVICPLCEYKNLFTPRPNEGGLKYDRFGYFVDLNGFRIKTDYGDMPSHFGRRCNGYASSRVEAGTFERCAYRWTSKECPDCGHHNDIAARRCEVSECRAEIVNPNDKLTRFAGVSLKNARVPRSEPVLEFKIWTSKSKAGNLILIAEFSTPILTFRGYYVPETYSQKARRHWYKLMLALFGIERGSECQTLEDFAMMYDGQRPSTVSYCLPDGSKYIQITNYNEPIASK